MDRFTSLPLDGQSFTIHGAIDQVRSEGCLWPWRLRRADEALYDPSLRDRCTMAAGARLAMISDASSLEMQLDRPEIAADYQGRTHWHFDLLVDGQFFHRVTLPRGEGPVRFTNLPPGEHRLEVYLHHLSPVRIHAVRIPMGAIAKPAPDDRPRWIAYGSSITQGSGALGPTDVWPVRVAQRMGLYLISQGVGGQCHLDPIQARLISSTSADYISLCLGINVQCHPTFNRRSFPAAVAGFILSIRDGHPKTPLVVVSPIHSLPRETQANTAGLCLADMREIICSVIETLTDRGVPNLHYVNGLDLFGQEFDAFMPDHLHPDTPGNHLLAERYITQVMPRLGLGLV